MRRRQSRHSGRRLYKVPDGDTRCHADSAWCALRHNHPSRTVAQRSSRVGESGRAQRVALWVSPGLLGHLQSATGSPDSCQPRMGSSETDARKGWASAADGLGFLQLLPGDPPGQEGARPLWPTLRPGVTLLLPVSWPKQVRTPAQTQRRSYKIIHGKAVETREGKHLWSF